MTKKGLDVLLHMIGKESVSSNSPPKENKIRSYVRALQEEIHLLKGQIGEKPVITGRFHFNAQGSLSEWHVSQMGDHKFRNLWI